MTTRDGAGRDRRIARDLTRWFSVAARALPWRTDLADRPQPRDPYHALVAEAMLQQTQVSRVMDYYTRFLGRFPSVTALARAPERDVLALWSGLGYYRRAKSLHAAARLIVERFGGRVPATVAQLRELPGVGAYTAGAIASMVFDAPEPLVDGNVQRVLQRLEARPGSVDDKSVRDWAWARAGELVRLSVSVAGPKGPARFNEGLMELGATVCLPPPASPRCEACPLRSSCAAHRQGVQGTIPAPKARVNVKRMHAASVILTDQRGRVLLQRRGDAGMWAGMWEAPTLEGSTRATPTSVRAWIGLTKLHKLGAFTHTTTHRSIGFEVYASGLIDNREAEALTTTRRRWVAPAQFHTLGLSSAQVKVLSLAGVGVGLNAKGAKKTKVVVKVGKTSRTRGE